MDELPGFSIRISIILPILNILKSLAMLKSILHSICTIISLTVVFENKSLAQPTTNSTKISLQPSLSDIPMDPTIRIGKLENGLTYYIQQNKKPEHRAELRMAVKAGSMQEDEDQLGLLTL